MRDCRGSWPARDWLWRGIDAGAWTVTLPVSLAPGEALARAARDVSALFRGG